MAVWQVLSPPPSAFIPLPTLQLTRDSARVALLVDQVSFAWLISPLLPACLVLHPAADKESSRVALLEDQVSVLERSAAAANEALAQALARAGELEAEARRTAALKRRMEQLQASDPPGWHIACRASPTFL